MSYAYPIDYDQFSTTEIIVIVEFLALIEDANRGPVDGATLKAKYEQYRRVINSIAMEKQIDKDFEAASGFSIYRTMQQHR
jgi:uncharacterized protein YktA (UPF0223 family)